MIRFEFIRIKICQKYIHNNGRKDDEIKIKLEHIQNTAQKFQKKISKKYVCEKDEFELHAFGNEYPSAILTSSYPRSVIVMFSPIA